MDDLTARLRDSAPTNEALCMSPKLHREAADALDSLTRERDGDDSMEAIATRYAHHSEHERDAALAEVAKLREALERMVAAHEHGFRQVPVSDQVAARAHARLLLADTEEVGDRGE